MMNRIIDPKLDSQVSVCCSNIGDECVMFISQRSFPGRIDPGKASIDPDTNSVSISAYMIPHPNIGIKEVADVEFMVKVD
jgi:hypothetical protein